MNRITSCLVFFALFLAVFCMPSRSPGAEDDRWYGGREFGRQLVAPASITWPENPLRQSLLDFGRAQHVAILVDRRVDPDQKLNLTVRDATVVRIIAAVADSRDLGVSVLGDVVYVGPKTNARRLRTIVQLKRDEIRQLGSTTFGTLARTAPMAWQDLDAPRDVLDRLAGKSGLQIVNLEQVPHDLWAGAELPPASLIERLTLLLVQFDLTFQVDSSGRRVALVPLPEQVAIVRDYSGGRDPAAFVERWTEILPGCEFRVVVGRVHVRGLLEDHERIRGMGREVEKDPGSPTRPGPDAEPLQVHTAKGTNLPLDGVLGHLAKQFSLELRIDHASLQAAGIAPDQLVSFDVKEATTDELFEAVLGPVGCVHERRGNVLEVRAGQ